MVKDILSFPLVELSSHASNSFHQLFKVGVAKFCSQRAHLQRLEEKFIQRQLTMIMSQFFICLIFRHLKSYLRNLNILKIFPNLLALLLFLTIFLFFSHSVTGLLSAIICIQFLQNDSLLHWNIALLYSITVTIHINDNNIFSVNLNIYFFFSSAWADSEAVKRRLQWWWDRLIVFESQAKTWLDRTFLLQLFLLQPKISNRSINFF